MVYGLETVAFTKRRAMGHGVVEMKMLRFSRGWLRPEMSSMKAIFKSTGLKAK